VADSDSEEEQPPESADDTADDSSFSDDDSDSHKGNAPFQWNYAKLKKKFELFLDSNHASFETTQLLNRFFLHAIGYHFAMTGFRTFEQGLWISRHAEDSAMQPRFIYQLLSYQTVPKQFVDDLFAKVFFNETGQIADDIKPAEVRDFEFRDWYFKRLQRMYERYAKHNQQGLFRRPYDHMVFDIWDYLEMYGYDDYDALQVGSAAYDAKVFEYKHLMFAEPEITANQEGMDFASQSDAPELFPDPPLGDDWKVTSEARRAALEEQERLEEQGSARLGRLLDYEKQFAALGQQNDIAAIEQLLNDAEADEMSAHEDLGATWPQMQQAALQRIAELREKEQREQDKLAALELNRQQQLQAQIVAPVPKPPARRPVQPASYSGSSSAASDASAVREEAAANRRRVRQAVPSLARDGRSSGGSSEEY
jgi:hypothetical protein